MKKMMHPLHGFHHAYNKNEEDAMRVNGWVDCEENKPEPVKPELVQAEPVKRGPGRPRKE